MVLWVSLFLYMRQRISALEDRVALLSKLTTAVAGVTRTLSEPENIVVENENENENDTDSDSDESDESDESEPQETSVSVPVHLLMDEFPRMARSTSSACASVVAARAVPRREASARPRLGVFLTPTKQPLTNHNSIHQNRDVAFRGRDGRNF